MGGKVALLGSLRGGRGRRSRRRRDYGSGELRVRVLMVWADGLVDGVASRVVRTIMLLLYDTISDRTHAKWRILQIITSPSDILWGLYLLTRSAIHGVCPSTPRSNRI